MEGSSTELRIDRHKVITNITALFIGSAITQFTTALALLLMARQIGPYQYGQYASSIAMISFASIVFSLGLDMWLLKEGGSRPYDIGNLTSSVIAIKVMIGFIWVVFFSLLAPILDSDIFPMNIVRLSALTVWLNSLITSALVSFKAILKNKISALCESTLGILWLLITLALIGIGVDEAVTFLIARTALLVLILLISLVIFWFYFSFGPTWHTIKQTLKHSPAYATSDFLVLLFMRVDILIVALMLGKYEAGLYSPAVGLINVLLLVPAAVYNVLLPLLSNLYSTNLSQARRTSKRFIQLFLIIGTVISLAVYIGSDVLVFILGEAYKESQMILRILIPVIFLHSITFGVAAILITANLQAKRAYVQVIAILADVIFNLILVPKIGLNGAALAYIISEIILLLGYSWFVINFHKTPLALKAASEREPGA